MAMNKTETARMEQLEKMISLRHSSPVECDLPAPEKGSGKEIKGYLPGNVSVKYSWPMSAVSDGFRHGSSLTEGQAVLDSHGSKALHSNRLDALKATRYAIEQRAAEALHQLDIWIKEEEQKQ